MAVAVGLKKLLTAGVMERLGLWLSMDLGERTGRRGRRQRQAMVGMFTTWCVPCPPRFRGSDFSLRVALLVHGWHQTGLPVLLAAERVARDYDYFLKRHLGKGRRGRHSSFAPGTEIDEVVRTTYYKFVERYPEIDVLLELWFFNYLHWCDWVISVHESGIELTVQEYIRNSQLESAKSFRELATSARQQCNWIELTFPRRRIHHATREERYEMVEVNGERLLRRLD
jgi:hypothetical protein